jgi:hypothetical protein
MPAVHIDDYAHKLYAAHGEKAEYEAAQRAKASEERGDDNAAQQWRKVRAAIRVIRGPNVS